ncbi:MAG TPA: acyltransferase family protein [Telluria sp.]|nr:acyltransferase family protein [Telluria sp.]
MDQTGRLHAFDNLRAVMMWLGIVLHVAVNHTTGISLLPWHDWQDSPVADLLLAFIHAFRMPTFFILAGFFVALLVASRGYKEMLRHRMRRLALPFAIFWPVLIVSMSVLMLVYLHMMVYRTAGIDLSLLAQKTDKKSPFTTMHMWFLYYLIWFSLLTAVLAPAAARLPEKVRSYAHTVYRALAGKWWGVLVLTVPLAAAGSFYPMGQVTPNGSFIPNAAELLHNGLFFTFGFFLHRHQDVLFPRYTSKGWWYAAVGLVGFVLAGAAMRTAKADPGSVPHIILWFGFLYNLTSWLWSLALIGLFLRYVSTQNSVLRYVSESSYWAFLVHMLGTVGFGILIYNLEIGAVAKMALNILLTTIACLVTYQLFVRHTVIGTLLNGKRRPKAVTAPAAIDAVEAQT